VATLAHQLGSYKGFSLISAETFEATGFRTTDETRCNGIL
jgi:hypothetical protein